MRKKFSLLFILSLVLSSCIKENSAPAYIHVPTIQFIPGNPAVEGSSNHNFEDAWISVDFQQIGANNLPTTLPAILDPRIDSLHKVRIRAGIQVNGIASDRHIYPFFDPYEVDLDLQPGVIDTFYPSFSYRSDVKFTLIDDFEGAGVVFGNDLDDFPGTDMVQQSDDVFEGQRSGQLYIDSVNAECYVSTSFRYSDLQLPAIASPVYLEMNYKTDVPLSVGLISHKSGFADQTRIKGGMNPADGWKKIYFELTEDLFELNGDEYSVILRAAYNADAPNEPKVLVDNIKLVHF
jgi:hypothetical protein